MIQTGQSIFREYYSEQRFVDRFAVNPRNAVDVIIPIIHTNELWRANLHSLYREIPIHRLLIGDGGCKDDSLKIVSTFPRVEIFDHTKYVSLGYSLRKLIEEVRTEWFIYVHSDVYLPPGWFDTMQRHQSTYDWFGCPQQITVTVEYPLVDHTRPYAGSQMGRKAAFAAGIARIDDDYVYRQEDFVLADIVTKAGYKEGRIEDTFHYHQLAYRPSAWSRKIKRVALEVEQTPEEELRAAMTQARGIVKYLDPEPMLATWVRVNVERMIDLQQTTWKEFMQWVASTNPAWTPWFRWDGMKRRLRGTLLGKLIRALRS
jgi:hypothetical protein